MPINEKLLEGVSLDANPTRGKTLRRCVKEGRAAFKANIPVHRNPYKDSGDEGMRAAWDSGWRNTRFFAEHHY